MSTKIALHMHHTLFSIFFHVHCTIRLANLLKLHTFALSLILFNYFCCFRALKKETKTKILHQFSELVYNPNREAVEIMLCFCSL